MSDKIKRDLEATRNALLNSTAKLMTDCSEPSEVTSRAIAKESGVNLAMINYCFGSREGLLYEVFRKPVHVAFYFDQSAYAIEYGPNNKNLYINPLVVTYDYDFDEIQHKGSIFPSSEMDSGLIGDYHKLMRSADVISNNMNPRTTSQKEGSIRSKTAVSALLLFLSGLEMQLYTNKRQPILPSCPSSS